MAVALTGELRGERRPFEGVTEEPGRGIRASVDCDECRLGSPEWCGVASPADPSEAGSVIAFRHGEHTAVFLIRQALRPDAVAVVRRLQERGLDCRIVSGDRPEAVAPIAEALGIAVWTGGVRPAGKIAALEALAAEGRRVAMVGDGLNDAPALAAADLAQAEADLVFLGDRLAPVCEAIDIARRARRLMTGNLLFSVFYNLCAVPLAILGVVTPLIAALAMSGSSLVVTLNALRARPPKLAHERPSPVPLKAIPA